MSAIHEKLIGRWVEYLDRNEATRIGKAIKIYGGRATLTMKYGRTVLRKERIPLARLLRVKNRRKWIPISEYLLKKEKDEAEKECSMPSKVTRPASLQPS
jgi:hypothetical protein